MGTYQAQVPLGGLPIHLVLYGNRERAGVVFVKVAPVGLIVENAGDYKEIVAVFDEEGFTFGEAGWLGEREDFEYNKVYDYKNIPLMLKWLQAQNLQQPW